MCLKFGFNYKEKAVKIKVLLISTINSTSPSLIHIYPPSMT